MIENPNKLLLEEIRSFLSDSAMGPSYFGKAAAGNSEVVTRLEAGKGVTLATAVKIRTFIANRRNELSAEPAE